MKLQTAAIILLASLTLQLNAQSWPPDITGRANTPYRTAMRSLEIAPDARAAGMGDVGIATSPDPGAVFWNPAKLSFAKSDFGVSLNYAPWVKQLILKNYYLQSSFYKQFNTKSTLYFSVNYYSFGKLPPPSALSAPPEGKPLEYSLMVGGAYKLTEHVALAFDLKYLHSFIGIITSAVGTKTHASKSYAFGFSAYGQNSTFTNIYKGTFAWGLTLSNLGPKGNYLEGFSPFYIPAKLGLGISHKMNFSEKHSLELAIDLSKLLVPLLDTLNVSPANNIYDFLEQSVARSILTSFSDSESGWQGELKEIIIGAGLEYKYNDRWIARSGYFYEDKSVGARRFFTVGVGSVPISGLGIDFSYLLNPQAQISPFDNTWRASIHYSM